MRRRKSIRLGDTLEGAAGRRRAPKAIRLAIAVAMAVLSLSAPLSSSAPAWSVGLGVPPAEPTITIVAVRNDPYLASVVGAADRPNTPVLLFVDGVYFAKRPATTSGEFWFLRVPVQEGSVVQVQIGQEFSRPLVVPSQASQHVGPPGFVYARGTVLMKDNARLGLFGPNEATAFLFALRAWGEGNLRDAGKNQLFPFGPNGRILDVRTVDDFWREYFRYFLHYKRPGDPSNPPSTLLRIWIADLGFGNLTYQVWERHPDAFYEIFDRMVYWATRANVYLVPVLGQNGARPVNAYYDRASREYARHTIFARALLQHYDREPAIAMWDLWNEADVGNDAYWGSVGGISGYRSWVTGLVADLRPYSRNHLITVGTAGWTLMPGLPTGFGWRRYFLFNEIPGIDVAHEHSYFATEDQYLIDWRADWARALGIPFYMGEYGYNGPRLTPPGYAYWPNPLGYGYWPWFTRRWQAANVGPLSPMVFLDHGRSPYADYPFFGPLPMYPPMYSSVAFLPTAPAA